MSSNAPPPTIITRHCAYPGCEKSWKTVEASPNHFHNESHRKMAEKCPEGSNPYLLAHAQAELGVYDPMRPVVARGRRPKRVVEEYVEETTRDGFEF